MIITLYNSSFQVNCSPNAIYPILIKVQVQKVSFPKYFQTKKVISNYYFLNLIVIFHISIKKRLKIEKKNVFNKIY